MDFKARDWAHMNVTTQAIATLSSLMGLRFTTHNTSCRNLYSRDMTHRSTPIPPGRMIPNNLKGQLLSKLLYHLLLPSTNYKSGP